MRSFLDHQCNGPFKQAARPLGGGSSMNETISSTVVKVSLRLSMTKIEFNETAQDEFVQSLARAAGCHLAFIENFEEIQNELPWKVSETFTPDPWSHQVRRDQQVYEQQHGRASARPLHSSIMEHPNFQLEIHGTLNCKNLNGFAWNFNGKEVNSKAFLRKFQFRNCVYGSCQDFLTNINIELRKSGLPLSDSEKSRLQVEIVKNKLCLYESEGIALPANTLESIDPTLSFDLQDLNNPRLTIDYLDRNNILAASHEKYQGERDWEALVKGNSRLGDALGDGKQGGGGWGNDGRDDAVTHGSEKQPLVVTMTTMRHPVERTLSLYWYEHVAYWDVDFKNKPERIKALQEWLETWADGSAAKKIIAERTDGRNTYVEPCNYYVKNLGNWKGPGPATQEHLAAAKRALESFDVVLLTEHIHQNSSDMLLHMAPLRALMGADLLTRPSSNIHENSLNNSKKLKDRNNNLLGYSSFKLVFHLFVGTALKKKKHTHSSQCT